MKTIVIGLDGASFDLIAPWLRAGKLPNLQRLIDNGVKGRLKSCLPPTTSPSWKCYSTGKNPGKLGIFWWENIDFENRRIYIPTARARTAELWDYLSENGMKAGVINMPLTYPPKQIKGFMIAGGPDAPDRRFTYPSELESRLRNEFGYAVHPSVRSNWWRSGKAIKEVFPVIENRFKVARTLAKEYELDFLHLTIFYINSLHHDLWNDEIVQQAWELLDRNIGALIADFEQSNVIIMSDHGTNEINQVFYINTWLEKQGYLRASGRLWFPRLLYRLGLNEEKLFSMAQKLHLSGIARRVVPKRLRANIPSAIGTMELEQKEDKIIWGKSRAMASGQGPLYLASNSSGLREELINKLAKLTNPLTGLKVAHHVYKREDIYQGEFLPEAPDIIIDQSPHTHIRGSIGNKNVFEQPQRWRAENTTAGIFIASGPDFQQGIEVEDISILDLTPTILHQMGFSIPTDMDGRVLSEIFIKGSDPANRTIRYHDSSAIETQKA
jgi:predicted AlkP superfamily phosphohydrolase/phosphomutase